jgi:hypothetical protein
MMARLISRIPGVSAQILAYDIGSRVAQVLSGGENNVPARSAEPTGTAQATGQTF